MLRTIADFLLGAGLSRRMNLDLVPEAPLRSPSRARGATERHEALGWIARVGTW